MALRRFGAACVGVIFAALALPCAQGQGRRTNGPPNQRNNLPNSQSNSVALYVSGKVVLQNGADPSEPIGIDKVCHGSIKREGFTDFKGRFQIQLGQSMEILDASDFGGFSSQVGQGGGSSVSRASDQARRALTGCELRASLAGYRSTSVIILPDGNSWEIRVGTIVLTRMEGVEGTTISLTTMTAPENARNAYYKGQRQLVDHDLKGAEKELEKAVQIYPQFAAAWSLLGDVHRQRSEIVAANEAYERAISADAQLVNPYFGLAVLALQRKDWAETVKLTDKIYAMNSSAFPLSYLYNSLANLNLGKLDAAEWSARKLKSIDTDHHFPLVCVLLANALAGKHNYSGAAQELDEYVKIAPKAPDVEEIKSRARKLQAMSLAKN